MEVVCAPEPVEQAPREPESEQEDEFEAKIKQRAIGKLDRSRFALQQTPDDVRRKQLEEERFRQEQEEIEVLKQEELRRRQTDSKRAEPKGETESLENVRTKLDQAMVDQFKKHESQDDEARKNLAAERWLQEQTECERLREEENLRREKKGQEGEFDTRPAGETDKPKSVGKLNQQLVSSFQKSPSEKKKILIENRSPQISESEAREAEIQSESGGRLQGSPASIREPVSNDQNAAEKRKVGKLNVNWMNVANEESAESERRKKQLEGERLRREQQELEELRSEQRRQTEAQIETIAPKQEFSAESAPESPQKPKSSPETEIVLAEKAEAVESSPPNEVFNEDIAYEEKRKSIGVRPLDFNKFLRSASQDMEERDKRKQELEEERKRIELEEIEVARQEELQRRRKDQLKREASVTEDTGPREPVLTRRESTKFVIEASKRPEGKLPLENGEMKSPSGGPHNGEMNGEGEEVRKRGKLDLGIWAEVNRGAKDSKQKTDPTPSRDSVESAKPVVIERSSPASAETRKSVCDDDGNFTTQREEPAREVPEEKPSCGKLDPSRFVTFNREPQQQRISGASLRAQDDSGVIRRTKERPAAQKARPKSIAVMGTNVLDGSVLAAPSQKKMLPIVSDKGQSEHETGVHTNGDIGSPEGYIRPVRKLDTSAWENRSKRT